MWLLKQRKEKKPINGKINDFLNELETKGELIKEMECKLDKSNPEGKIIAFAELAKKLGYDITEDDLKNYISDADRAAIDNTQEASDKIVNISDDNLDMVAGGAKNNPECHDTYMDEENCFYDDGWDGIYRWYIDYANSKTHRTNRSYMNSYPTKGPADSQFAD